MHVKQAKKERLFSKFLYSLTRSRFDSLSWLLTCTLNHATMLKVGRVPCPHMHCCNNLNSGDTITSILSNTSACGYFRRFVYLFKFYDEVQHLFLLVQQEVTVSSWNLTSVVLISLFIYTKLLFLNLGTIDLYYQYV